MAMNRDILSVAAVVLSLAACDRADDRPAQTEEHAMGLQAQSDAAAPQAFATQAAGNPAEPQLPVIRTRLIRTGAARVEVSDLDRAVRLARELTRRLNGVVAESEVTSDADMRASMLLIRVPADSLDALVRDLTTLGEVRSVSLSSTDVSREYFDAETRLAVKQQTVRRLTQLIERSTRVEDLVAIERELSRATTELEMLKGQIRYFDLKVAESDLRLHMTESGRGLSAGALRPVKRSFRTATQVLGESLANLIYLVVFIIPWLVAAVLLWLLGSWLLRVRRRRTNS